MKSSLIITSFFLAGLLIGIFTRIENSAIIDSLMEYSLYFLMLAVGISTGSDPKISSILRSFRLKTLLLPLSTILGTYFSMILYTLLFSSVDGKDAFAIASGFGYYSLSSLVIRDFSGAEIGIIALLANIIREIITLLTAPFTARILGPYAPISSAGATSMDTTLPVIIKSTRKNMLIPSVFHGVVLTVLVPFLITIIYKVF